MYCSSRPYILVLTTELLTSSSPEECQLNGGRGTVFPSFICVVNAFGMLSLANVYNLGLLGRDRALLFADGQGCDKTNQGHHGEDLHNYNIFLIYILALD